MSVRTSADDRNCVGEEHVVGEATDDTTDDTGRQRAVLAALRYRAPRRALVLELLCHELTYVEMATLLMVSPATVKMHLRTIYRQLGVRGAVGAVVLWRAFMQPDSEIAHLARPLLNPDDVDDDDGMQNAHASPRARSTATGRW